MPVTFSQIASDTANATVTTKFGDITIVYYPNQFTKKLVASIEAGTIDEDVLMTTLIKSWDVMEDADQNIMFPISRIDEFGIPFKLQIMQAIVENIRPNTMTPQTTN